MRAVTPPLAHAFSWYDVCVGVGTTRYFNFLLMAGQNRIRKINAELKEVNIKLFLCLIKYEAMKTYAGLEV
jgi:hypothetical protein